MLNTKKIGDTHRRNAERLSENIDLALLDQLLYIIFILQMRQFYSISIYYTYLLNKIMT